MARLVFHSLLWWSDVITTPKEFNCVISHGGCAWFIPVAACLHLLHLNLHNSHKQTHSVYCWPCVGWLLSSCDFRYYFKHTAEVLVNFIKQVHSFVPWALSGLKILTSLHILMIFNIISKTLVANIYQASVQKRTSNGLCWTTLDFCW